MKRVPRIKFPQRHKQSSSSGLTSQSTSTNGSTNQNLNSRSSSDVPAPPRNTASGGTASLQPKRTPVSDKEIEAILLGGCL